MEWYDKGLFVTYAGLGVGVADPEVGAKVVWAGGRGHCVVVGFRVVVCRGCGK